MVKVVASRLGSSLYHDRLSTSPIPDGLLPVAVGDEDE